MYWTLSISTDGPLYEILYTCVWYAGGQQCVAYRREIHDPGFGESPKSIEGGEVLVLFHYITRSYEEFVSNREPKLVGAYAKMYRELWEASTAAKNTATPHIDDLDEFEQGYETKAPVTEEQKEAKNAFDAFEETHGFNHEEDVCSSVVKAGYLSQCCGQSSSGVDAS